MPSRILEVTSGPTETQDSLRGKGHLVVVTRQVGANGCSRSIPIGTQGIEAIKSGRGQTPRIHKGVSWPNSPSR
jgi:hypothetical protein